jgi:large subunit ribosomal protein L13
MKRKTHIIDATNKALGRLASGIAILLMGKNKPNFDPSKDMGDFVVVKNVEKIKITGKKMDQKKYYRHSGYMGGLKEIPLEKIFKQKPAEVFKKAVLGMLPKNRLRKRMIMRLKFE